ncbi:hypothetical protein GCM10011415_42010 [Salipiger pallidus]|uniref:Uncharacterized protein n=1 Tax=Salipiger pallidus TaxID=1775170 RepID=A0A8J3EIQ9_9RHOB|nr:hypothetical protein GCM10011415_42010 [Salipiger pallidus]
MPRLPQLVTGASELAGEMGALYALSLVREVPFAALGNPHHVVTVDRRTHFTLHELLCELRSLSFFEGASSTDQALCFAPATASREGGEDLERRRQARLNGDGQLTLRTLLRGRRGAVAGGLETSAFHAEDLPDAGRYGGCDKMDEAQVPATPERMPGPDAPMSRWLAWIEMSTGARLSLPGQSPGLAARPVSPLELALRSQSAHPCRVHYNAALRLLAQGVGFAPGLAVSQIAGSAFEGGAERPFSSQKALSLMVETAQLGLGAAMRQAGRSNQMSRPGVQAARLTAALASPDRRGRTPSQSAARDVVEGAARELAERAPNLLRWIDRLNRERGVAREGSTLLLLPSMPRVPATPGSLPPERVNEAASVVIAGALSTLLKAVFDTGQDARLRLAGRQGGGIDIAREADRLASDAVLARLVTGSGFHAEAQRELRLGEAIAVQMLRGRLQRLGGARSLGFTDFDGREAWLGVAPITRGAHHVSFRRSGRPAPWPMETLCSGPRLAVI